MFKNIIDLHNNESWYYSYKDGIQGRNIYTIGSDKDWVWFMTKEGVSLYNWERYHAN